MSDALPSLLQQLRADARWTEITGDDFEDQELRDGMRFDASIEIRETQPAGWQSHFFAILDEAGDWDDPYEEQQDDDDEEDEG